ncbi:MAG: DoxX family membrane protein [Chloroherpetonaceae bacterium]|nr:DoxX family membrane protein [Chloroherpetonaceae bacterium]
MDTSSLSTAASTSFSWSWTYLAAHPFKTAGIVLILALRYFFAIFFLYGFWHKLIHGWLWTDVLRLHFIDRLSEISPEAWQAAYLQYFAIPLAMPIAWIVTVGELIIGLALVFGVTTRLNAAFGLFMLLNFAAGAFYNIWIDILSAMAMLFIVFPTGHWLGFEQNAASEVSA